MDWEEIGRKQKQRNKEGNRMKEQKRNKGMGEGKSGRWDPPIRGVLTMPIHQTKQAGVWLEGIGMHSPYTAGPQPNGCLVHCNNITARIGYWPITPIARNGYYAPSAPIRDSARFSSFLFHFLPSSSFRFSQVSLLESLYYSDDRFSRVGVYTLGENDVVESHHSHAMEEKIGVLLLNLGGPETLKDVQPFLYNLFADPDIIRLPGLFKLLQWPLAKLTSVLRAPKSEKGYAAIGGGSPLRKITDEQANALRMALEAKNVNVSVYVGMRYWYPFTEEVIEQVDTLLDGIKWDDKGLAMAIAQNVDTGAILMQGFVNKGALATIITSRKATFFSRSRATLWTKGETSNNFINIYDKRRNKLCVQFSWRGFLLGHDILDTHGPNVSRYISTSGYLSPGLTFGVNIYFPLVSRLLEDKSTSKSFTFEKGEL
ncbi:hypothetical protein GOBAR_DD02738 [Gossypium barbadense]|nr:hypothetical protein GOBAR_DD02738 [Gossypium barbadense]